MVMAENKILTNVSSSLDNKQSCLALFMDLFEAVDTLNQEPSFTACNVLGLIKNHVIRL